MDRQLIDLKAKRDFENLNLFNVKIYFDSREALCQLYVFSGMLQINVRKKLYHSTFPLKRE